MSRKPAVVSLSIEVTNPVLLFRQKRREISRRARIVVGRELRRGK